MMQSNPPNFSNKVAGSRTILQEDDLRLAPNVREYIRQKKFHMANGIDAPVPLEKVYGITQLELVKIWKGLQLNQPSRPEQAAETWKERVATAPLRLKFNNMNNNDSNSSNNREKALAEPGVTMYGGSINPAAIDIDSKLRGNNVARTRDTAHSTMDTCLVRSVPDYRGGEIKSSSNTAFYRAVPFTGIGSGFGDMNVNNNMHFGENTRTYQDRKITDVAMDRFEPLINDDFQHPDSVVLPFPRGGIDTRNFDRYSRQDQFPDKI
jgi:hypothetical protein